MNQGIQLAGAKVTVLGMAKSGAAAVDLLLGQGAKVTPVDQNPAGEVHGLPILPQSSEAFRDADLVVVSPGVPADSLVLEEARERGIQVIGEVELAGWFLQGDTIGITGSNGKTTTTALTGHILQASGIACQVGGNIGTPPTAMVATSRPGQWNVLELSSFQLETIQTFHARVAVALNVTDNHLDRHYTFANYAAAKGRLFETQRAGDTAVLNADDATASGFATLTPAHVLWFGAANNRSGMLYLGDETLMPTADIPLKGRHNAQNVIAAALASSVAGASPQQIADAVRTFPGVPHRLEFVRTRNEVAYYNDSKATSVDATLKAIDAFDGNLWIILGGKDKNSDYSVLRDPLHAKAHAALLIGSAAPKIESALAGAVRTESLETLEAAVAFASEHAKPGDVVLLAPACASYDQFRSFEHRGDVFKNLVPN